ncbi:MAG: IS66 family insertion sequence element accessory protein TnpA [Pirellula sp.]
MHSSKRSSRAEFWQQVLEQFTDSKLSVAQFCSQNGLSVQSPYQWKRKLQPSDRSSPNAVVPVRIIPSTPVPSPQMIQIITPKRVFHSSRSLDAICSIDTTHRGHRSRLAR